MVAKRNKGDTLQGKVTKIFSDFYYVNTIEGIVECKLREVLKKAGHQILVGDDVVIENYNPLSKQAAISELLPRKNSLFRPNVANIDQIILVISLNHPKTPLKNIDRYLAQAEYFGMDIVICANKTDLATNDEIEEFKRIYSNLGYNIFFTSALKITGVTEFSKILQGKTSLFCGASGVGKTSLTNVINKNLILKTGDVSKNSRGAHTTRHCEIIPFFENGKVSNIVDTPGFSLLKFDYIEPQNVKELFKEIKKLSQYCKYSDCLHENEHGCYILDNKEKIENSRYESYLDILQEAKEYKKKIQNQGKKIETKLKKINEKVKPKISSKKRDFSRRKTKQLLSLEVEE